LNCAVFSVSAMEHRKHHVDGLTRELSALAIEGQEASSRRVAEDRNLLLISGAVPGAEGGQVIVRPSVKAAAQKNRKKIAPAKQPGAKPATPAKK